MAWRPSVVPSMAPLREMWPYARPTLLSRASDLLFGRVHTIAIAKVHGAAPLGLYARAEAVPTSELAKKLPGELERIQATFGVLRGSKSYYSPAFLLGIPDDLPVLCRPEKKK